MRLTITVPVTIGDEKASLTSRVDLKREAPRPSETEIAEAAAAFQKSFRELVGPAAEIVFGEPAHTFCTCDETEEPEGEDTSLEGGEL